MDLNNYFQEKEIDLNICRWNLGVYNCKDEEYFRSVYYIKLVIAVLVSILDSILIIYRLGIKRRNIITPYGIASIDGLLIFTAFYSYAMIFHSINIIKGEYVKNFILQEYSFQSQYIFLLIAIQIYLTGTLNASPRYQGSKFYYPRPKITNTISFIILVIWLTIEIIGIYFIGSTRNYFYTSGNEEERIKNDNVFKDHHKKYTLWTYITNLTFSGACIITFVLFFFFGINLTKAAKRSLEEMYRSKKIKSNVVIPIQIALFKMKWINGACNVIMLSFACLFGAMAFSENRIFGGYSQYLPWLSKILCITMNLIPPALTFIVLLSIVYGEARTDIIAVFPSTHFEEEEYQMNYTKQSQEI